VGQKIRAYFIVLIVCASYIFVNKMKPKNNVTNHKEKLI
jgi:uncharacterized protein YpmB